MRRGSTLEFELIKSELGDGVYRFDLTIIRNGEVFETDWFTMGNGKVYNDLLSELETLLALSFGGIDPIIKNDDYIKLIELFGYSI